MRCQNCGNPSADIARFCSSCGAQQRLERPAQPAPGEAVSVSPMPESAFGASDVTVILPRRRADALVERAAQRVDAPPSASPSSLAREKPPARRSTVPATRIGAAVVVTIAIVVAAAFYMNRPATPAAKVVAASTRATQVAPAPAARTMPIDLPDGGSPRAEAPGIAPTQAPVAGAATPMANMPAAPEVVRHPDVARPAVAPAKAIGLRKKPPAPARLVTEPPAPSESPAPVPVEIAMPAPVQAPPIEPVKVEKVACADSSNPFARELCLWQECAKPEFRSHAECARFTGPGGER